MDQGNKHFHEPEKQGSWWFSRTGLTAGVFLGFIAFFLVTEHTAHTLQFLPWLIILLCPFMHMFMHHGGHGHNHDEDK